MKPIRPHETDMEQVQRAAEIIESGFDPSDEDLELIEDMIEDGFEDYLPESVLDYMDEIEVEDEDEYEDEYEYEYEDEDLEG